MNSPEAFYIGVVPIPWYGIMLVLGAFIALFFAYFRWRKIGYSNYHWWLLVIPGLVIAVFGARWWYLMFNPGAYTEFMDLFRISGGRAIQGTIFFVSIWIIIYSKWIFPQHDFRRVADIILPSILLAQAIGRWGNFYNSEIYGTAAESLWWLPEFIQGGMYIDGYYRQPFFLYESVLTMIGWYLLFFVMPSIKWFKPGTAAASYLIYYNVIRAIMEPMRAEQFQMNINGFPTTLLLSIIYATVGVCLFAYFQFFYDDTHKYLDEHKIISLRYWKIVAVLNFKLMTNQINKNSYTTIKSVSKNKYN